METTTHTGATVQALEHNMIRVFSLSMTDDELATLTFSDMLRVPDLQSEHAEMVQMSDLAGLGLAGYLSAGHGVPEEAVAPDRAKLDALDGSVLIVFSAAFGGVERVLAPDPRLTLIGTYAQEGADWSGAPIQTDSAAPYSGAQDSGKKPMSDARIGGMVATAVLLFLALFVFLFVWLAG